MIDLKFITQSDVSIDIAIAVMTNSLFNLFFILIRK
jgi:hypothetical protein